MSIPAALQSAARVDGEHVYSMGVLSEISPQSQYSQNFKLDLPLEVARRSGNGNPSYPWHGVQDLSCLRGQWAFTTAGVSGGFANVHDTLPAIFTVANGFSKSTPIRFVGIVDKTVIAEENKDPSVSCTVGGIRTGVNTSHLIIGAGCKVVFDWPLSSGVNGTTVPKFTQKGVPKTAFMFRTLPLKRDQVFSVFRSITSRFFKACDTVYRDLGGPGLDANRENWETVRNVIAQQAVHGTVENAMADAHKADVIIQSTSDTRDVLKRYIFFLMASIGGDGDFNTHTLERESNDLFDDESTGYSSSSIYARSGNPFGSRKRNLLEYATPADANHSVRDNPLAFVDYLFKFYHELDDILKQRIMGECMLTSDAGGRLDLMMRNGRK